MFLLNIWLHICLWQFHFVSQSDKKQKMQLFKVIRHFFYSLFVQIVFFFSDSHWLTIGCYYSSWWFSASSCVPTPSCTSSPSCPSGCCWPCCASSPCRAAASGQSLNLHTAVKSSSLCTSAFWIQYESNWEAL